MSGAKKAAPSIDYRRLEGLVMAHRIYVRNLARGTTEGSVRDAFAQAGRVSAVQLVKNRETGDARGFAFVTMNSAEEATSAVATMNGALFGGRSLRVSRVLDHESRSKGSRSAGSKGDD
jgi:RNA recognition motif-containing protein